MRRRSLHIKVVCRLQKQYRRREQICVEDKGKNTAAVDLGVPSLTYMHNKRSKDSLKQEIISLKMHFKNLIMFGV